MKVSKSLLAVASLATLASCTSGNTTVTTETPSATTTTTTVTPTTTTTETSSPSNTMTDSNMMMTTDSEDMEKKYSQNVTYTVPAGDVVVKFDIELDATTHTIKDAGADLVSKSENDNVTPGLVEQFDDAIDNQIVGKKLADIQSLDAVGGASLTTEAFKKFAASIQ